MEVEERAVLGILRMHLGRQRAITVAEITSMTGYTDFKVRHAVSELVRKHGCLIGAGISKPKGFFLIQTHQELKEELDSLLSRAGAITARAEALSASAHKLGVRELKLF